MSKLRTLGEAACGNGSPLGSVRSGIGEGAEELREFVEAPVVGYRQAPFQVEEPMLRNAIREYLIHYHQERIHQGLDNQILEPGDEVGRVAGQIHCRERLGGLLKYYSREAA